MDLSIKNAQEMISGTPPSISELRGELADRHSEEPQRAMLADIALREAEEALAKLASLGHHFHLVEGEAPTGEEFPKMLYRDISGVPSHRTVENAIEEKEAMQDGWRTEQRASLPPTPPPEPPPPSTEGAEVQGLPPEGAAGAGAKNDRSGDLHSVVTEEQREQIEKAQEVVAPRDPDQANLVETPMGVETPRERTDEDLST